MRMPLSKPDIVPLADRSSAPLVGVAAHCGYIVIAVNAARHCQSGAYKTGVTTRRRAAHER